MSFQLSVTPHRRAAARFVAEVHRKLSMALADAPDVTQTEIAGILDVHRSVVNRQLRGQADMTLSRVAEIACILGYDSEFVLSKSAQSSVGTNTPAGPKFSAMTQPTALQAPASVPTPKPVFENA